MMFDRRRFAALLAALAPVWSVRALALDEPEAIVRALYAAQGAALSAGGKPVFQDEARWPALLTPGLITLWRKTNSRINAGRAQPIRVDPFTGAAQSAVSGVTVSREQIDSDSATVLARFRRAEGEGAVAYTLRLTGAGWRIDDAVSLIDGRRWSLRRALSGERQRP